MSRIERLTKRSLAAPKNLGFMQASHYFSRRALNAARHPSLPFKLHSKYSAKPLWCRPGTSDMDVFDQIFTFREYRCLDALTDARFIIDCGANVGFSAAYFLSRFPRASCIAVEPDSGNFAAMERNLAPFGERLTGVCSGVWSHACGLAISDAEQGPGREWARTVREIRPGEHPAMIATDVGTLLRNSGFSRISVLKIDIEGSEVEVFKPGSCDWLSRVDNLVIELHGLECEDVFHRAIDGQGFSVTTCDELTVCTRR